MLKEQLSGVETTIATNIPLGSLIATNGNITQSEMNQQGRARCDGTEISSQVPDATLKGTTLNLAGRTLVGEGQYAKDTNISFQLGHVDQYSIGKEEKKGEVEHKLTLTELPYHTHNIQRSLSTAGTNTNYISYSIGNGIGEEHIET
jgi:microcystin-dependent protein